MQSLIGVRDEAYREHLAFMARLCRERIAHKEFFVYGGLLGELPLPPDMPTIEVQLKRKGYLGDNKPFETPAVRGAVWCDTAGRRCVFIVNVSGSAQTFSYGSGTDCKTVTLRPRSVVSEMIGGERQCEGFDEAGVCQGMADKRRFNGHFKNVETRLLK